MMPRSFSRFTPAVALLAVAACAEAPTAAKTPATDVALGVIPTKPSPNLGLADIEFFEVCKYYRNGTGPAVTIDVSVSGTSAPQSFQVVLNDGQCKDVWLHGGAADVVTVTEQVPAGYAASYVKEVKTRLAYTVNPEASGNSASGNVSGTPGEGAVVKFYNTPIPPSGEIGDLVWVDANNNGQQDVGEAGIPSVTVTLSGAANATATTDANGNYLFTGLAAGNYTVTVGSGIPAGYAATTSLVGSPIIDSNGSPASVTLPTNSSIDHTIDFGYVPPLGQLGDFVWVDTNGNGQQDFGEPGIPNVTVTLSGAASATTTTDASGKYLFTNLAAGNYTVTVGAGIPSGYTPTTSNVGSPTTDSNGSPANVTLPTNVSVDLTIDFGYVAPPPPPPVSCTLTQGYWKTHEEDWDSAADNRPFLNSDLFYNSGKTYLQIMNIPPAGGNTYLQLAHQFIAARLNVGGAPSSGNASVDAALAGAAAYFASAPAGIPSPKGALKTQLGGWATTLDSFNNGLIGPGHCN